MAKNDYAVQAVHADSITMCIGGNDYNVRYTVQTVDGTKWARLEQADVDAVKDAGNYSQWQMEDVIAVMLGAIEQ